MPHARCPGPLLERVREVRRALGPWEHEQYVRDLDDRLYGWGAVVSALA
ncbi:hypothetical protein AB0I68_13530 [Streptomyces sp. NPDC050448]